MGTGWSRQGQEARSVPVADAKARAPKRRGKEEIELGHCYILKMIEQSLYIMKASYNRANSCSQNALSPHSPFRFPSALPKSCTESHRLLRLFGSSALLKFHIPQ